ncbi:MAG: hypothetical protein ACXACP_02895 [Candidatus Hodarchaeales archaeon]|jgi:hypothetical protein
MIASKMANGNVIALSAKELKGLIPETIKAKIMTINKASRLKVDFFMDFSNPYY